MLITKSMLGPWQIAFAKASISFPIPQHQLQIYTILGSTMLNYSARYLKPFAFLISSYLCI